ncbi:MAG: polysaccharide deacetylase family protein, partial [Clostridia bacterium]|nr:polysaccharide deacetylase family protein [Clostridia bacterium]
CPEGLSFSTIEHSYGVAKDEQPHEISVNNQKFFDEKGFDAIAYDNKTDKKVVYLTFDCGYENGYTAKILDTLRDKGVKAAFFCTLPEMRDNPEIIARMISEGHIVGNHSVTHPDFSSISREQMYEEVKGFDDFIRENFGFSAGYFRYPQGKYSENSL